MKRRNVDNAKLRRTLKKNKISDGLCGNLIYFKLLLVWTLVIVADFLLGVRFEYLWTFWLLLRSIYDSFRYQGVAFSVFFVCVTVTSDLICFVFIPVQWLFFLASTYVWVQYVWHADRGVCVPTVSLWLLFIYVEASVRLKELKFVPFTLDLCRPFAAHCIGYPVVTLGFGVKSYVSYRLRLRKQREVARVNGLHKRLLSEALPIEEQTDGDLDKSKNVSNQTSEEVISNGAMCSMNNQQRLENAGQSTANATVGYCNSNNATAASRSSAKNFASSAPSLPKKSSSAWRLNCNSSSLSQNSSNGLYESHYGGGSEAADDNGNGIGAEDDLDEIDYSSASSIFNIIKAKLFGSATLPAAVSSSKSSSCFQSSSWKSSLHDSDDESRASKDSREGQSVVSGFAGVTKRQPMGGGKQKSKRRFVNMFAAGQQINQQQETPLENVFSSDPNTPQSFLEQKEKVQDKDLYVSLESDIDKLKNEMRMSRAREQDLRNQIQQFALADTSVKNELQQLRQNNEQLQTRIQNLVRSRQQDKQNMATVEKKLADEQKLRAQTEQQLTQERKQKKAEEASRGSVTTSKSDCVDSCKQRRRELESQLKQVRRDLQQREEQVALVENELRALRAFKEHSNVDILMSALSAMQEKNVHLEAALSSETRIKLDLFSALGEAKRQLEIVQGKLSNKEQEAEELRRQLNDETAVSMYMNHSVVPPPMITVGSPLTPPPSVGAVDGASLDLLGPAAYQTAAYMSALPGVMFSGEMVPNDYGALPLVAHAPTTDVAMHFSSTHASSH